MALAIHQISPVAHLPLVLGVVRKLNVAALIDTFCPPHPAHVLSCGRGVKALLLAMLDGHHALSKVGARLEERGILPLLQPGWTRASLHDDRLGQIREARFAAHLNRVFGGSPSMPWMSMPSRPPGYPRIPRPSPSRGPMRGSPTGVRGQSHLVLRRGPAKMARMIASQGSCVSACAVRASHSASACALAIPVPAESPPWPLRSAGHGDSMGAAACRR